MRLPCLLPLLSWPLLAHGVELAVVRPFASRAETLIVHRSFDLWTELPPCNATPKDPIDLFLVYSRNLTENSEALTAVNAVVEDFRNKRAAWHRCFRSVQILSANLTAEEDQYDPRSMAWNSRWVSGPNAVFRFIMRSFLGSKYDALFIMELDSMPRKPHWIEQFTEEVVEKPSAAIRGSRYRGDNWDAFAAKMPPGILSHINGNAIYYPAHPLLAWLSAQLHMEVGTPEEGVAYDVRMSELIHLARTRSTAEAGEAWDDLVPAGQEPYSPDSMLIGNYANTLLNASFDGGEFIAHVAMRNIYTELDGSRVSLAVSHFSDTNLDIFQESLNSIHPFREVVILTTEQARDGRVDELQTPSGSTSVAWRTAKRADYLAFCELAALVNTEFFVFTDTFHVVSSPVSILVSSTNGTNDTNGTDAPVLPYLSASSWYCRSDARCTESLRQAERLFNVTLDRHFDTYDTVFVTSLARSFCSDWEASVGGGADAFRTCSVVSGPSADDYFAWLLQSENLEDWYKKEDRVVKGWRSSSLLTAPHPVDLRSCATYGPREYRFMKYNISACNQFVERPDACNAAVGCMWRPMFQSGKCLDYHPMHPAMIASPRAGGIGGAWAVNATENLTWTNTTTTTTTTATTTTNTTTATTTTSTTSTATTTSMTTVPGAPTVTVTSTSTTTTTIPVVASIGTVLIHINETRVDKENVGAVLDELRSALQRVKNGTGEGVTNFISDPDLRIELTETSGISLQAEPTPNEKVAILSAIRDTRCGNLTLDQCDVQEPNSTVGLKAEKGAVLLQRRLQASASYRFEFVVFIIIRDAVDLATTMPITDPGFASTFQSTAVRYLRANATATAGNSSNSSGASARVPTFVLFGGSGVPPPNMTMSFTRPVAATLTVINVMLPENAPVDLAAVQKGMTNSTAIMEAIVLASGSSALVLAPPVVDLCLGRTCGGNGVCSAGACQCDRGWSGNNCLIRFVPPPTPSPPTPAFTTKPPVPDPLSQSDENTTSAAIGGAVAGSLIGMGLCVVGGKLLLSRRQKRRLKATKAMGGDDDNESNVVISAEGLELEAEPIPGEPDRNDLPWWPVNGSSWRRRIAQTEERSAGMQGIVLGDLIWPGLTTPGSSEIGPEDDLFWPGVVTPSPSELGAAEAEAAQEEVTWPRESVPPSGENGLGDPVPDDLSRGQRTQPGRRSSWRRNLQPETSRGDEGAEPLRVSEELLSPDDIEPDALDELGPEESGAEDLPTKAEATPDKQDLPAKAEATPDEQDLSGESVAAAGMPRDMGPEVFSQGTPSRPYGPGANDSDEPPCYWV